jgi:hypothetical protein
MEHSSEVMELLVHLVHLVHLEQAELVEVLVLLEQADKTELYLEVVVHPEHQVKVVHREHLV